jgi:hypothetical protein
VVVDSSNSQWAPAVALVTGPADGRQPALTLHLQVPVVGGVADFTNFPQFDIWIAGDPARSGDISLIGQLLQNPSAERSEGHWTDIDPVLGLSSDTDAIDVLSLPPPGTTGFTLAQAHWTGIANTHNNWQLQLFAERNIRYQADTGNWVDIPQGEAGGVRIRSNPLLITLTREAP